jgi:hypothetical protein
MAMLRHPGIKTDQLAMFILSDDLFIALSFSPCVSPTSSHEREAYRNRHRNENRVV